MALIYAGIDEAGYGPLLGPLCVGMSVFEVADWREGEAAPDLWSLLATGVCRKPNDRRRRIAVDDSKALKLSNGLVTKHPLVHLERGVGSFLACAKGQQTDDAPLNDLELFRRLGVAMPAEEWYAGAMSAEAESRRAYAFPAGLSAGEIAIGASVLRGAMQSARVVVRSLTCEVLGEGEFNQLVEAAGTKAAATESALIKHLWSVWELASGSEVSGVRVVCDRQGGRAHYTGMLSRAFPDASVTETHQSETQSRYEIVGRSLGGGEVCMHVLFLVESERHHLPVALASMSAKLVREMMMRRFNDYWRARAAPAGSGLELKATAGYRGDGQRWLDDLGEVATKAERAAMIRRA